MHLKCCILECMIRRHRNNLVRELWRVRATLGTVYASALGPGGRRRPTGPGTERSALTAEAELQMKSSLNSILKRLDIDELEYLLDSIKSMGHSSSNKCILLPQTKSQSEPNLSSLPTMTVSELSEVSASRFMCRLFRWNDLTPLDVLKSVPSCQSCSGNSKSAHDSRYSCINPYHWSKVVQTDITPVTCDTVLSMFSDDEQDTVKKDIPSTTETETSNAEHMNDHWCKVGYWEHSEHIGQFFPVIPNSIDIFKEMHHGNGISLDILHKNHVTQSDKVRSVRSKIGAGVTLSLEHDKVWLYNHSDSPVFTSSFSLNINNVNSDSWRVFKVNPGHAIVVYNFFVMEHWNSDMFKFSEGPVDPHSIHVSFVKGWGRDYHRQSVLYCDCWLEILLNSKR